MNGGKRIGNIKYIIEVWAEYAYQLKGVSKNSRVYDFMCEKLKSEYGITLNADELRDRIQNLKKKYKQEQKKIGPSGETEWEHYATIHNIMSDFQLNPFHEVYLKTENLDPQSFQYPQSLQEPILYSYDINSPLSSSPLTDDPLNFSDALGSPPPAAAPTCLDQYDEFLYLATEEHMLMNNFLEQSLRNEERALELLEVNNNLLASFLDKQCSNR